MRLLSALLAVGLAPLAVPACVAQTAPDATQVHPITLSPDAPPPPPAQKPKHTRKKAAEPPPGDIVPPDEIHPITSLPLPPTVTPAAAEPAPASVPALPAPVVAAPVEAAPTPQPQPVTVPPAPQAAPPPAPTPVDVGPPADHAAVFPEVAQPHTPVRPLPAKMRPFDAIGIGLTASTGGAGLDIAVPLAQHINARIGASVFQYSGSYGIDGVTINGEVKFRDARFALDLYPFKGTKFRISPGVTVYNGNNLNASAFVAAGQVFTLNDVDYTSAANDPVHGSASMTFGYRTAPSMTIGWGNLVPRNRSRHFSIPFEIGAQYIDNPKVSLVLAGTACSTESGVYGCGQLSTDPIAQENLREQEQKINNDLHAYARFYPIISIGVGWSFNLRHTHDAQR
jgi:hypothetical protein